MQGKRVLVTGASGFIGRHLIEKLLAVGADIYALSRNGLEREGVTSFAVDITDKNRIAKAVGEINPQIVFHLASTLDRNPNNRGEIIKINYGGTVNLLEALDRVDYERFVFASTAELYCEQMPPFKEDMAPSFNSPYSESKSMAEKYCQDLIKKGKPIVILRPFIVYGPGQSGRMFIPSIMEACKKGERFEMSSGMVTRDFIYVDDAVDAFIKSAESMNAIGQVMNICSGVETRIIDLANLINRLWQTPININADSAKDRPNDILSYYGDDSKVKELLGWKPEISLAAGIEKTIAWHKSLQFAG